jgi:DnaJ-class molecular chaperone
MTKIYFETLGLSPTATPTELKAKYRELMKLNHPDQGGDGETFDKINKAYKKALEIVLSSKCQECGGSGKIQHRNGLHSIGIKCPVCGGSGFKYRC